MRNRIAALAMMSLLPLAAALVPSAAHAGSPSGLRFKQLSTHCVDGHCRQRQVDREPRGPGGNVDVYFQHRDWNRRTHAYGPWSQFHLNHVLIPCSTGLCHQAS